MFTFGPALLGGGVPDQRKLLNHFETLAGSNAASAVGPNMAPSGGAALSSPGIYGTNGFVPDGSTDQDWTATFSPGVGITPSTPWTIELSIRPAVSNANGGLFRVLDVGLNEILAVSIESGQLQGNGTYATAAGLVWGTATYAANTNYRLGFQWNPSTSRMELWVNGSFVANSAFTGATGSPDIVYVVVGRGRAALQSEPMNGRYDEVLLHVGTVFYPTAETPPFAPTSP